VSIDVKRRRTYAGEESWFPVLEELGPSNLRRAFIVAGVSPRVAGNLVWFLEDQWLLDRHQTDTSRSRYRATLRDLDPERVLRRGRQLARPIPGLFKATRSAA
jgi:hypothetical protein